MFHLFTMTQLKNVLELLYFASGITIAIFAWFALEQVRVMKKDLSIRVERAAKEKAIEFAGRYGSVFVPLHNAFYHALKKQGMNTYKGPIKGFSPDDLSKEDSIKLMKRMLMPEVLPVLNELNYFASAFAYGVADEKTGFEIVGRSFCGSVGSVYDIITGFRSDPACQYWAPIVKLYGVWSARLSRTELEAIRNGLESSLERIPTSKIPTIGEQK